MAYIMTNGLSAEDYAAPSSRAKAEKSYRKSWLARFVDATIESRMRSAAREIERHKHFLPLSDDMKTGFPASSLPFNH